MLYFSQTKFLLLSVFNLRLPIFVYLIILSLFLMHTLVPIYVLPSLIHFQDWFTCQEEFHDSSCQKRCLPFLNSQSSMDKFLLPILSCFTLYHSYLFTDVSPLLDCLICPYIHLYESIYGVSTICHTICKAQGKGQWTKEDMILSW